MSKEYNTPQLRFPGFEGEWEEKKLSDVFTRLTKKNTEDNKNILTISAQYGLISQLDFFKKSVSASDVTGYYLLRKGDFAYNKSSSQGRPVGAIKPLKLYDKGVVSTLYICFKCKDPNAIGFWEQYFDASIFDKEIMSIAQEGARNHGLLNVPTKGFFDLTVLEPTPTEQKKIAECLEEIDNLIAAQEEKVDALKEKKRGLMQQLFPQEGETTPRLRFPGFEGEWDEREIGESFNERSERNRGDLPLLSLGEKGLVYYCETDKKDNSNKDKSKYLRVAPGDVAYNTMRMWQGRCVCASIEGIVSPAYTVCKPKNGVNSLFHYYLFKTYRMIKTFHQNSQGLVSDTLNLKFNAFSKIKYHIPSPDEQKIIAECLEEIDKLIVVQEEKLDALKDHKRGLMQQLFPQPNK